MVRLKITVSGHVQGVGFRYFTQMKAIQYGISGWVKNSSNGTVEIVATGDQDQMDLFIDDLKKGNPFSNVSQMNFEELTDTEPLYSFKIRY